MFGHHNDEHKDDNQIPDASIQGALQDQPVANPAPQASDNNQGNWGHPGTPIGDNSQPAPSTATDTQTVSPEPTPATPAPASNMDANSLVDIKQQALGQLSPIFEHLDQSPEEKFRTTMMMIQATDNQELIPKAYEAANAINDEKEKAQALLDVINEINYFTQQGHHHNQDSH